MAAGNRSLSQLLRSVQVDAPATECQCDQPYGETIRRPSGVHIKENIADEQGCQEQKQDKYEPEFCT